MASEIDIEWIVAIRKWAETEALVEAVYLFGSRVIGAHRFDSDLDVAVIVAGEDEDERSTNAMFCEIDKWRDQLQTSLPVKLDLEIASDDDRVVMPAIRKDGVMIFDRKNYQNLS